MPDVQDLTRALAEQLAAHRDHPNPRLKDFMRRRLDEAVAAVRAIPEDRDPHTAAARALAAVERTNLNWADKPPFGGRRGYVAQMDVIMEATAPAQPHGFLKVTVPVYFFIVDVDAYAWKVAVYVGGQWYTRHCAQPDEVQELGQTVQYGTGELVPYPWDERADFAPDPLDRVKEIPVEFPLLVRRFGRDWDGWRAWIPTPEGQPTPPPPFRIAASWRTRIPARSVDVLEKYVNKGGELSGFFYKLLSGDVFGAAATADEENAAAMGAMLALIASDFPGDCYGTPEAVRAWAGLNGQEDSPFEVPESWTAAVQDLQAQGPRYSDPEPEEAPRRTEGMN
ncbi:hypothetical protein [Deinococcus metallilatus]|uniref:Uncharacterized protein n=1 Tax=Deinococcus metallilatus TaxID=1211322 RepID=A0AAJ5JWZ6_9DEIO|nr:hypothetical protein [Deinococcus metallilatus]MBB5297418.1 hypothetical protein [Deinococcus metallilatus]RXJ08058.1 hypothetical protein ERJ73_19460 [Deinococcus metallilatus]TLK20824.1 hypothetical protein FCS05_19840 [Deinococcus metallilatus]GMA17020.1 hypothetical protein GCM10025871_33510 [Deinococcus metallilatus]